MSDSTRREPLTDEQMAELVDMLTNPARLREGLSDEENARYDAACQSVVDARRYAERHAHEYWIG